MSHEIVQVLRASRRAKVEVYGVQAVAASPDNFGNWIADFTTDHGSMRFLHDRGQLFVDEVEVTG